MKINLQKSFQGFFEPGKIPRSVFRAASNIKDEAFWEKV